MSLKELVKILPKAELHLHIEGSLEPELMMHLAQKHDVDLPYRTVEEITAAYNFDNLQSFLDLYYLGASVLIDEDDFYQLMWQYLIKCKEQNIVHLEVMFDPQTHTERGIAFETVFNGFKKAMDQAEKEWGQSTLLIMSFLRHLSEQSAFETLEQASPYLQHIDAVGLDSSELGNPPEKFAKVFEKAKALGLKRVAHAGEEGPPSYIVNSLELLDVDRIDHGVRCVEDEQLVKRLISEKIPLTVCPYSNIKLCVFDDMSHHNIVALLRKGLLVTVNSDDPSYFGGHLNENYFALIDSLDATEDDIVQMVKNSFIASFLPENQKQQWIEKINQALTLR